MTKEQYYRLILSECEKQIAALDMYARHAWGEFGGADDNYQDDSFSDPNYLRLSTEAILRLLRSLPEK